MSARNAAYDSGLFGVFTAPVPVIAVGNLTAGGTGKTPLVSWIVGFARARQARPVILSRGYGRRSHGVRVVSDGVHLLVDASDGGDEPVQLARTFPDVPVVVGERRSEAARVALSLFHPDVLVLDDAFQHRAIARDLNILVVDGTRDLAQEQMLPAGRRREPLSALARASVVVFTHVDPAQGAGECEATVRQWFHGHVMYCTRTIGSFVEPDGRETPAAAIQGERCLLVSGIGNPGRFENEVRGLGAVVNGHLQFRDHHRYTEYEVNAMVDAVAAENVQRLVTTEKDMARLLAVPGAIRMLEKVTRVTAAVLTVQVHPAGLLESHIDACLGRAA
jgi:tetraacyldisaccharide 4'-kinase